MQKGTQPSWRLMTDAPIDLNFAIYVACSYDLLPDTPPFRREQLWSAYHPKALGEEEHQLLAGQWQQWWNEMIADRSRFLQNGIRERWSHFFASEGYFDGMVTPLRERCEDALPSFREWWGKPAGGQQGVNYWDLIWDISGGFRLKVKQVETEIGRTVQPFSLAVDYLYTGLGGILEIDSNYAMMSVQRPNLTLLNREWWLTKVRELA